MSSPDRNDCAVVLCCDQKFLAQALCLIRQIQVLHHLRAFDFVIAAPCRLDVPDWADGVGIRLHQSGDLPVDCVDLIPANKIVCYNRLMLARELADRYRRILYLDCDIMMEGGDLNRLFAIDLGEHPLGAVLDAPFFANLHYLAAEYRALNLSQHPYLNGGVLLIDTARYIAEAVEERAFAHCVRNPAALRHADQSALNLALMGKFAQLAPCWNWQGSRRLPFATFRYPVFLRHFIGPVKPDRYSGPNLAARHNQAYRDFLTQMMPDHLPGVAPAPDPSPLTLGEIARFTLEHLRARPALSALFARHADPYRAIL